MKLCKDLTREGEYLNIKEASFGDLMRIVIHYRHFKVTKLRCLSCFLITFRKSILSHNLFHVISLDLLVLQSEYINCISISHIVVK